MSQYFGTKVVFVSNYYNHHQAALSEALFSLCGDGYYFIETAEMPAERKKLGYSVSSMPSYVFSHERFLKEKEVCLSLISKADVVIAGSAPEELLRQRKNDEKLIFRYSERLLKKGDEWWKYLYRRLKFPRLGLENAKTYMLCASAYAARDFNLFGLFRGKCYRWGYFPEVKKYANIEELTGLKQPASMLWVARHIAWKHPEFPIGLAKRLKEEGYSFTLDIIGTGELEESMRQSIAEAGLEDRVHMLGAMKPEEVRAHMERSEIFLFTSDRNEGWGAVLNEAMNSACAVVASHAIGSVPYLLKDGENGFIYRDGDAEDFYRKAKVLLDDRAQAHRMGQNAYRTMTEEWNAEVAAEHLLALAESLCGGKHVEFVSGPCAKEKKEEKRSGREEIDKKIKM